MSWVHAGAGRSGPLARLPSVPLSLAVVTEALMAPGHFPGSSGTRNLHDNLSDLHAQVAANQKGIQLVNELIGQYGLAVVQAYMAHIQVRRGVFALLLDNEKFPGRRTKSRASPGSLPAIRRERHSGEMEATGGLIAAGPAMPSSPGGDCSDRIRAGLSCPPNPKAFF